MKGSRSRVMYTRAGANEKNRKEAIGLSSKRIVPISDWYRGGTCEEEGA